MRNSGPSARSACGDQSEVLARVLHADEGRRLRGDLRQRLDRQRHAGASGDVVDEERQRRAPREIGEVRDQSALRRTHVVRRHDEERVGARLAPRAR